MTFRFRAITQTHAVLLESWGLKNQAPFLSYVPAFLHSQLCTCIVCVCVLCVVMCSGTRVCIYLQICVQGYKEPVANCRYNYLSTVHLLNICVVGRWIFVVGERVCLCLCM